MSKVLIIGDIHFDRSLPHHKLINGKNDRYEFQKRLFMSAIKDFDLIISLGDVTHQKDTIDGKIMSDYLKMIEGKKIIHVLGNHDWSGSAEECSMGEIIAQMSPNYAVVKDVHWEVFGKVAFVFASYYALEEHIQKAVEEAIKSGVQRVIVCGHFNFWSDMMGGKKFSKTWMHEVTSRGVRFVLGHIHPPSVIPGVGEYIGVISPLRFKESQGRLLVVDTETGGVNPVDYEFGEEFVEIDFEDKSTWAFKHTTHENKYIKVLFDASAYDSKEVREQMMREFEGARSIIVVPKIKEEDQVEPGVTESAFATEEDYVLDVATEKGLDTVRIMAAHNKVREMVE